MGGLHRMLSRTLICARSEISGRVSMRAQLSTVAGVCLFLVGCLDPIIVPDQLLPAKSSQRSGAEGKIAILHRGASVNQVVEELQLARDPADHHFFSTAILEYPFQY